MKPAPFAYFAPDTLDEALALLAEHGSDAKVLAGGQTLGPVLNMRLAQPSVIVDINRVAELDFRRRTDDGGLAIGALTRESTLDDDPKLREIQPLVAEALPHIAHRAIRNRGTVGGSIANADPAAEWTGLVTALDAQLVLRRKGGATRTLGAPEFFVDLLTTALEPDELLVEVRLPAWPSRSGWSFMEFNRRRGDFALAGVLVRLGVDGSGRCEDSRIALIGIGSGPVRAHAAEAMLNGEKPNAQRFDDVAHRVMSDLQPNTDHHASADYRRRLAGVLTRRALTTALDRARGA